MRTAWISRLSVSAGARFRFDDLAPAEDPFFVREELTAAPKGVAAEVLPSEFSRRPGARPSHSHGKAEWRSTGRRRSSSVAPGPQRAVWQGAQRSSPAGRVAAVGEDLGEALDAVLLHGAYIGEVDAGKFVTRRKSDSVSQLFSFRYLQKGRLQIDAQPHLIP